MLSYDTIRRYRTILASLRSSSAARHLISPAFPLSLDGPAFPQKLRIRTIYKIEDSNLVSYYTTSSYTMFLE
jgi:hypothetical protein